MFVSRWAKKDSEKEQINNTGSKGMTTEELEKIQEIIQEELNNLEIDTGVDPTERLEDIERRIVAINDKLDIILGILCEEKE